MLVWCSLLLLVAITVINVPCSAHKVPMQISTTMQDFIKYSIRVTKYTHVKRLRALSLNRDLYQMAPFVGCLWFTEKYIFHWIQRIYKHVAS